MAGVSSGNAMLPDDCVCGQAKWMSGELCHIVFAWDPIIACHRTGPSWSDAIWQS